jgi:hypothetical protein
VGHVGADLALGPLDPLLDLGQVLIDQLRPLRGLVQLATSSTPLDVVLDRTGRFSTAHRTRGRGLNPAGQGRRRRVGQIP